MLRSLILCTVQPVHCTRLSLFAACRARWLPQSSTKCSNALGEPGMAPLSLQRTPETMPRAGAEPKQAVGTRQRVVEA